MIGFFPQLVKLAPELELHLLARALPALSKTNNPLIARFELLLSAATKEPRTVFLSQTFFDRLDEVLLWANQVRLDSLAAEISDALIAAERAGVPVENRPNRRAKIGLSLGYAHRWREAIEQWRMITNQIVRMEADGPWGKYPAHIVPAHFLQFYREKLGEPPVADPLNFEPGKPVVEWSNRFVFLPDGDRFWIACCDRVVEQPMRGGVAVTNRLDISTDDPPQVLAQSADTLWIGTAGSGLFRLDKQTRKMRRYTTEDGLLFDGISALYLAGNSLWIGQENRWRDPRVGEKPAGGLAMLDLTSDRLRSFAPPLPAETVAAVRPGAPRLPVRAIGQRAPEEIWLSANNKFNPVTAAWSSLAEPETKSLPDCLAASAAWVVAGRTSSLVPLLVSKEGVGEPVMIGTAEGLPFASVTTVALDGDRLWVGGPAYLAIFDLQSRRVIGQCLMDNTNVEGLAIAGDNVWVRLNRSLYRFPRALNMAATEGRP